MKGPILVVLAAGMGTRYGGLKQMEKLGKSGEVLLDFSVYDAVKSGFEKALFIIRHDFEDDFRDTVLKRMKSKVECDIGFQELDYLLSPEQAGLAKKTGRTKPWGTVHALLCVADKIDAPFALINADDFYSRQSFAVLGKYLSSPPVAESAIVPYQLERTLSPQGTVARGYCEIKGGYLSHVEELLAIEKKDGAVFNTNPDGSRRNLSADAPVSMNFWGFPPPLLNSFKAYWEDFIQASAGEAKSECLIPGAVDLFIKNNVTRVKVLNADSEWFGVTYKEDREAAVKRIAALTEAGVYPASLWA
jgi:dTDP-glucose pyrophosphorylase